MLDVLNTVSVVFSRGGAPHPFLHVQNTQVGKVPPMSYCKQCVFRRLAGSIGRSELNTSFKFAPFRSMQHRCTTKPHQCFCLLRVCEACARDPQISSAQYDISFVSVFFRPLRKPPSDSGEYWGHTVLRFIPLRVITLVSVCACFLHFFQQGARQPRRGYWPTRHWPYEPLYLYLY